MQSLSRAQQGLCRALRGFADLSALLIDVIIFHLGLEERKKGRQGRKGQVPGNSDWNSPDSSIDLLQVRTGIISNHFTPVPALN